MKEVSSSEGSQWFTIDTIPSEKSQKGAQQQALGIRTVRWSADGRHLAVKTEKEPARLWIWSVEPLKISAVLEFQKSIQDFQWHPKDMCIAACTGGTDLYLWNTTACSAAEVPPIQGIKLQVACTNGSQTKPSSLGL